MDGRLRIDDEPAHEHCQRDEQPDLPALGQRRAQRVAHRREADVHTRQKQHEPRVCVQNAHHHPQKRQLPQPQRDELEHQEEHHDRQQRERDLLHVFREGVQIVPAQRDGIGDGGGRLALRLRGLRLVDRAQQQNRRDRSDGAQADEAERVRLRVLVGTDRGHADTQRHDERHGHRPGRHAAGIERDGQNALVGQKRREKHQRVEHDQQQPQRDAEQNAHHAEHQEDPDAHRDRQDQDGLIDLRHVGRQHLQIRLRHRDGDAQQKADHQNQPQLARFGQLGADVIADLAHGHLRAQRKQAHAEDQQRRRQDEGKHQARIDRHEHKADGQHDQADRQHGGRGLL